MRHPSLPLLALLTLAACNQPADQTAATNPPTEASPKPKARPEPAAPPAPALTLAAVGSTYEATAATFKQLPASELPARPIRADSPELARQQRVRRDGGRLVFTLDNGQQAELKDVDSQEPDVMKHYYWGELPTAHQWVAHVGLWEGWMVALIDQRSGRIKYVWGQPFASPDGQHLLTTSADLEAGYDPNGVQLFRVQADSLQLLGERKFEDQGPEQARWLNNHAVVLEMQGPHLGEGPFPSSYLGLELAATPAPAGR